MRERKRDRLKKINEVRRRRRLKEDISARDAEQASEKIFDLVLDIMDEIKAVSGEIVNDYDLEGVDENFWYTFLDYLGEADNKAYGKLDVLPIIYLAYRGNKSRVIDAVAEAMEELSEPRY